MINKKSFTPLETKYRRRLTAACGSLSLTGFTLIELIMVLVIIGMIAGIAVPVMLTAADAWSLASRFQDNAVSSAMLVQNRMSREIRRVKDDASIRSADSSALAFIIPAGAVDQAIVYYRSNNILMRQVNDGPADGLADNVTSLEFIYYNNTGDPLDRPVPEEELKDICRIEVRFAILAGTNTLNFQFQVRPQNLNSLNEKFN